MSRFPFILLLSLLGIMVLNAQTPLEKMNSIKMSNEYVWDEYTHASADTAVAGAMQRLLLYIDVPDGRTLTTDDIQPSVKLIKMKRSNLTRVFAYLKKEEAQAIARFGRAEGNDTTQQPTFNVQRSTFNVQVPEPAHTPMPFAMELMQQGDFYVVYKYLQEQKDSGRVIAYGPLKDAENINNSYLVIFDKQTQHAVCILSPVITDDNRTDMVKGHTDSLANYEDGNHIAIWFNMKQ